MEEPKGLALSLDCLSFRISGDQLDVSAVESGLSLQES